MFLITGGRGAVGTHLLDLLRADGHAVRVGSRRPEELGLPADVPGIACDLTDPNTFPAALSGVDAVFLYAESAAITEFVSAATEAGVEHIVLLSSASVLSPDAANNPIGKAHLDTEIGLADAPMTVTVLRPGTFAGNARFWAGPIKAGQPVSLPYPNAYTEPIHERDIAACAHAVLTAPKHRGGQHSLTGPEALTFREQLDRVASVIGRPVPIAEVSPAEWKDQMAPHMPGFVADGLLEHWLRHDGVPTPLTDTVTTLTGQPARTFTTWLQEHADEFRS
ncbi:SDR family oxidoreductase [Nocardia brasiliensis]|uniref:SDR family oxidoreductase n=1 Tax=Nocardia brasiliensis TaxID=37326 RepID=UPI003D8E22CC